MVLVQSPASALIEQELEYIDLARYIAPNFTETNTDAQILEYGKYYCDKIKIFRKQGEKIAGAIRAWRDSHRPNANSKPQPEYSSILKREVVALVLLSRHLMCPGVSSR